MHAHDLGAAIGHEHTQAQEASQQHQASEQGQSRNRNQWNNYWSRSNHDANWVGEGLRIARGVASQSGTKGTNRGASIGHRYRAWCTNHQIQRNWCDDKVFGTADSAGQRGSCPSGIEYKTAARRTCWQVVAWQWTCSARCCRWCNRCGNRRGRAG